MASGGSALFEAEIAKYLLEGKELKTVAAGKTYLGFCEAASKKNENWAVAKELEGEAGKGYPNRLSVNASQLKMHVWNRKDQSGKLKKARS